jgi:hypothetical protein
MVEVTSHMFALLATVPAWLHDVMSCSFESPEVITFLFSEEMRNTEMQERGFNDVTFDGILDLSGLELD